MEGDNDNSTNSKKMSCTVQHRCYRYAGSKFACKVNGLLPMHSADAACRSAKNKKMEEEGDANLCQGICKASQPQAWQDSLSASALCAHPSCTQLCQSSGLHHMPETLVAANCAESIWSTAKRSVKSTEMVHLVS